MYHPHASIFHPQSKTQSNGLFIYIVVEVPTTYYDIIYEMK